MESQREDCQIIPDLECVPPSLKTPGVGLDGGRSRWSQFETSSRLFWDVKVEIPRRLWE